MEREFPNPILPEEEVAKDPQILNNGDNDAFVFLEVKVPYANVVTAKDDGIKNSKQDTQLFNWDVNENWVLVGSPSKSESDGTITYVYGYVGDNSDNQMEALSPSDTTPPLFTHVRFANVVEDQGLENTKLDIIINAYAIQTTNINDNDTRIDGNNSDGKITVGDVWDVVAKQTGVTVVSGGQEDEVSTYSVKVVATSYYYPWDEHGVLTETPEITPFKGVNGGILTWVVGVDGEKYVEVKTDEEGKFCLEGINFDQEFLFGMARSVDWDDGKYSTLLDPLRYILYEQEGGTGVKIVVEKEESGYVVNVFDPNDRKIESSEYSDCIFFSESENCLYITANYKTVIPV